MSQGSACTGHGFLVAQRLSEVSEFFCGPTDYYDNHRLGHFAPLATGITLDEHLGKAGASYPETIKLAIALVHGHALLSQHDLAHGDPCLGQVKIRCTPSGPEIAIYDFDDYAAPGVPPPPCYGREGRLTPELRLAMNGGPPCPPDELSSDPMCILENNPVFKDVVDQVKSTAALMRPEDDIASFFQTPEFARIVKTIKGDLDKGKYNLHDITSTINDVLGSVTANDMDGSSKEAFESISGGIMSMMSQLKFK